MRKFIYLLLFFLTQNLFSQTTTTAPSGKGKVSKSDSTVVFVTPTQLSDSLEGLRGYSVDIAIQSEFQDYNKYKSISGPAIDVTTDGITAKVIVHYDSDMKTDFSDILFIDGNGTNALDQWRESYVISDSSIWWIEVPTYPDTGWTGYMLYDKDDATLTSDGEETFPFFDDFIGDNGDAVDNTKWTIDDTDITIEIGDNCCVFTRPAGGIRTGYIETKTTYDEGYGLRIRSRKYGALISTLHYSLGSIYYDGDDGEFHTVSENVGTDVLGGSFANVEIRRESDTKCRFWYNTESESLATTTYANSVAAKMDFGSLVNTDSVIIDWVSILKLPNAGDGGSDVEFPNMTVGAEADWSSSDYLQLKFNAKVNKADSTGGRNHYFSRNAGVDTAAAHMTLINSKLNKADSTGTGADSYMSRTAGVDSLANHWTAINERLKQESFGDSLANYDGDGVKITDNGDIEVLTDSDGSIEITDDSLNVKLDGTTLVSSASGLKVRDSRIDSTWALIEVDSLAVGGATRDSALSATSGSFTGGLRVDKIINANEYQVNGYYCIRYFDSNNLIFGNAGDSITSAGYNILIGEDNGFNLETGYSNVDMGYKGIYDLTTGGGNTGVGNYNLHYLTTGNDNSAFGNHSLYYLTTADEDIGIGCNAGMFYTGGSPNKNQVSKKSIYLGVDTKAYADGDSFEVVMGYDVTGHGTNSFTLGSTTYTDSTYLYGKTTIEDAPLDSMLNAPSLAITGGARVDGIITGDSLLNIDHIKANSAQGLLLTDDAGDGITIEDGGNVIFSDNINVDEYIFRANDGNTAIRFLTDQIKLIAGGLEGLDYTENDSQDKITFNDNAGDVDFRIESANNENAFFLQGSDGNVGIGTISPDALMDLEGSTPEFQISNTDADTDGDADSSAIKLGFDANDDPVIKFYDSTGGTGGLIYNADNFKFSGGAIYYTNSAFVPIIIERNNASSAYSQGLEFRSGRSGNGVESGDQLLRLRGVGELDTGSYPSATVSQDVISSYATEAWVAGAQGKDLRLLVTQNGTTSSSVGIKIQNDADIEIMNGNVGIGTDSPQNLLDVNGEIRSSDCDTVASAATITLGHYNNFVITGNTNIDSVDTASDIEEWTVAILEFSDALTFTNGKNIDCGGNITVGDDDFIWLQKRGEVFYVISYRDNSP